MMNIVFKDVGQGDSIILQWQDEGINKIGVIDCNKPNKEWNPVLEHLKLIGDFSFDFLILSHPHEDHYSGMMELLEYVDREEIKIGTFIIHLLPLKNI